MWGVKMKELFAAEREVRLKFEAQRGRSEVRRPG